ncbi:DUF418 domain-containing protein [Brachybacterium sp. AOP42-C2-15]|uniref:DUF418 domain-containing protein n=1 Tax=unclassified Brachybacterium TaxID=2623841 RepID=UPI004034A20D
MSSSAAPSSDHTSPSAPARAGAARPHAAPRSLAPDIARGLMLALIAIANVSWFLWGHEGGVGMTPHVPALGPADSVVQFVMTVAVDHRAMPLFAFLFGYGMVQFYRSRIDRGMEPRIVRLMMRRRHWSMLLLGFLHAALLFYGDILGAYAVAALLGVWLLFGRRTRTLIIWASVIGGVMVSYAVFSIVGALGIMFFAPPEVLIDMQQGATTPFANDWLRDLAYAQPYLVSMLTRAGMWVVSMVPAAAFGAPLPILLGWIGARARLLDEPWRHTRTLRRLAVSGIAIGWLTGLPEALVIIGVLPVPEALSWTFLGLTSVGGICCGIGYAAAFGLLAMRLEKRPTVEVTPEAAPDKAQRRAVRAERAAAHAALSPAERAYGALAAEAPSTAAAPTGLVRALSAVGQRSLTFYLFQSLLLAPLLAAWGLGLAPHLSTASAVAVALGVWLLSLPLAAWMDSRGLRGPAEVLLRRMTYGKHDPRGRS